MKIFTPWILLTLFCASSYADRVLLVPPIRLGALHDFKKDAYGNATTFVEGAPLLMGTELFISLQNLSGSATEGTIELTDSGRTEYLLDAAACCPGRHMKTTVSICSNVDGDFKSNLFGTNLVVPKAVKWSLGPSGKSAILVSALFEGEFSLTDTARFPVALFHFRPTLKIVVKGDRGAISGSVAVNYLYNDNYPTCDMGTRKTISGSYGSYLNQQTIQQLFQLNGGRPF